jgi:hypothetical protein
MPWFTLKRNYLLSTTKGHSVNFKKGERTWVPQGILTEALAIGAVPEEPVDPLTPEQVEMQALTTDQRKEKVFAAYEKLMLRAQRGDFSASGQPSQKKVEEIVGFEMDAKERDALWVAYNAMKQDEVAQKA